MLSIEKINFPITFKFYHPDMQVTFTSKTHGEWGCGGITGFKLEYFVNKHNNKNPDNIHGKDGYYEMAACGREEKREYDDLLDALKYLNIKPGQVNLNGAVFTASVGAKDYDYICKVENMPVGATLLGVQRENGEWDELKFKPRRIEVHDDVICLLSGYAGGYKSGNNYGAEINIKIGTNVKIKNSTNC
ncbi:hypothetical protein HOT39_gp06 [Escherichia phage LL5]|uniref:Uncharacterized protein n=1 Tax=Escherichia phage LL5 TaxID=2233992 RepID=A0A2Z4Q465_9CAUD|nr:hypothetical protein HOT39_gp06 [Escherichia phage LL5]AWY04308.1 hypothetical protein CPT_LL5_06 [Escherichia phage LL5]